MRKTFCDRDGRECTSRIGYVHIRVAHQTNQGETVGDDEYKPVELCGECIDELKAFFGHKLTFTPMETDVPMTSIPMARARDVLMPESMAADHMSTEG